MWFRSDNSRRPSQYNWFCKRNWSLIATASVQTKKKMYIKIHTVFVYKYINTTYRWIELSWVRDFKLLFSLVFRMFWHAQALLPPHWQCTNVACTVQLKWHVTRCAIDAGICWMWGEIVECATLLWLYAWWWRCTSARCFVLCCTIELHATMVLLYGVRCFRVYRVGRKRESKRICYVAWCRASLRCIFSNECHIWYSHRDWYTV